MEKLAVSVSRQPIFRYNKMTSRPLDAVRPFLMIYMFYDASDSLVFLRAWFYLRNAQDRPQTRLPHFFQ